MNKEPEITSTSLGTEIDPALSLDMPNVEIRIREERPERLEASEREVAVVTAAQGWVVRLMVLVAVLVIAALYVGAPYRQRLGPSR